jgi:putative N6-adenine-specific DNA methylase
VGSSQLHDVFCIAAPGIAPLLTSELHALGIAAEALADGAGAAFRGDTRALYTANLQLRTASRVVVRVAQFRATSFAELERACRKISWEDFVGSAESSTRLRVTCRKSRLYHSDAVAERVSRALDERVGSPAGSNAKIADATTVREDDDESGASSQLFLVRLERDVCTISADSSGVLLHRRGYRQATVKAPLRETLAAAMVLASGWDGEASLADPFCGSGTIAIEAALIARRIAPGIARHFAFERWPTFEREAWDDLMDQAAEAQRSRAPGRIVATDRDAGAIEAAVGNAERAGVATDIEFGRRAVSASEAPEGPGWVVTNPPYGVRVGERDLRNLYSRLGDVLRTAYGGWNVAVLSADPRLDGQLGLELEERLQTLNGGIRVRLLTGNTSRVPPVRSRRLTGRRRSGRSHHA